MTIFRNVNNQSALYDHHASRMSIKQFEILFKTQCIKEKIKEHAHVVKMDKKRLKVALTVLNAVRGTFPETNEFIDSTLKEDCEKEKMTAEKVIFQLLNLQKKLVQINIFVLDLVLQ